MAQEQCQVCSETGYDRRTLFMSCFYDMSELGLPFGTIELDNRQFFTLRVCKECRANWMSAIANWFKAGKPIANPNSIGTGIFVRKLGVAEELRIKNER